MLPTDPLKKASGTNTAISTTVMPMMAPEIWPMALRVASRGGSPSSLMMRSTFSTTTMASSTTMPITSTMPNMVSTLMEKPSTCSKAKVPISATGTTMVGMMVYRKFCKNRNITRNTRITASTSVSATWAIEIFTKRELS